MFSRSTTFAGASREHENWGPRADIATARNFSSRPSRPVGRESRPVKIIVIFWGILYEILLFWHCIDENFCDF